MSITICTFVMYNMQQYKMRNSPLPFVQMIAAHCKLIDVQHYSVSIITRDLRVFMRMLTFRLSNVNIPAAYLYVPSSAVNVDGTCHVIQALEYVHCYIR